MEPLHPWKRFLPWFSFSYPYVWFPCSFILCALCLKCAGVPSSFCCLNTCIFKHTHTLTNTLLEARASIQSEKSPRRLRYKFQRRKNGIVPLTLKTWHYPERGLLAGETQIWRLNRRCAGWRWSAVHMLWVFWNYGIQVPLLSMG